MTRARSSASRSRSSRRSGCYIPLGHRYAGAPAQLEPREVLAALDAVARRSQRARSSARTSSTRSMRSPTTASSLRGCAHDTVLESYVLESHKPHDLDSLARRHLDLPTIGYDDGDRQGRAPDSVRPGRARPRDRVRGRGRRRDAAPASTRCGRRSSATRSSRTSTRRSSCRCATCCSGWSATAC